jgi:hypothetical protein
MMCAYLLKPESKEHGWLYRMSERGFDLWGEGLASFCFRCLVDRYTESLRRLENCRWWTLELIGDGFQGVRFNILSSRSPFIDHAPPRLIVLAMIRPSVPYSISSSVGLYCRKAFQD